MPRHTYEQVYADHSYLWAIDEADDMTGGYVDSEDLDRLLKSPSKTTARNLLIRQIDYWFSAGTEGGGMKQVEELLKTDDRVREIAERYLCI